MKTQQPLLDDMFAERYTEFTVEDLYLSELVEALQHEPHPIKPDNALTLNIMTHTMGLNVHAQRLSDGSLRFLDGRRSVASQHQAYQNLLDIGEVLKADALTVVKGVKVYPHDMDAVSTRNITLSGNVNRGDSYLDELRVVIDLINEGYTEERLKALYGKDRFAFANRFAILFGIAERGAAGGYPPLSQDLLDVVLDGGMAATVAKKAMRLGYPEQAQLAQDYWTKKEKHGKAKIAATDVKALSVVSQGQSDFISDLTSDDIWAEEQDASPRQTQSDVDTAAVIAKLYQTLQAAPILGLSGVQTGIHEAIAMLSGEALEGEFDD